MPQDYDAHAGAGGEAHDNGLNKSSTSDDRQATQAMSGLELAPSELQTTLPLLSPTLLGASPFPSPLHSNVGEAGHASAGRVTTLAPDPLHIPAAASKEGDDLHKVAPPGPLVPPGSCDQTLPRDTPSIKAVSTTFERRSQSESHDQEPILPSPQLLPDLHHSLDGPVVSVDPAHGDKMIFGHYSTAQAAQAAQRRRNYATTNALTDYEADMTSKDRAKQKEAVKRYLAEKVKQDWTWEWPRPQPTASEGFTDNPSNAADIYTVDEDWKERDEWLSNASDDEDRVGVPASVSSPDTPSTRHSPYRFESPDGVGDTIKRAHWERKQRRKKRLAEEMAWNSGLQCFVARRDAWTGARKVSRSSLGFAPVKTIQPSSISSEDGGSSTAMEKEDDDEWEDDVEIPIAPPILPPENQMRASILPGAYNTIYDKVVIQSLQPSCPMNLKDITRSCVQGWKRDGEWPPKSSVPEPKKKGRKMSVASLFGLDKYEKEESLKEHDKEKERDEKRDEKKFSASSGIKKSIQKILNIGHNASKDKDLAHNNGNGKLLKGSAGSPITGA